MRIAIVGPSSNKVPPDGYGSEGILYVLAREFVKRGHEVHLYAPYRKIEDDGIIRHAMKYTPSQINIAAEASSFDSEINNMEFVLDASATCIFSEFVHWKTKKHIPHACWRNGIDFTAPRIYRHNIVVLSQLAKYYALTGSPIEDLYNRYGKNIAVKQPVVIGYGTDKPKMKCSHDGGYYLWFSRFTPEKGFIDVIKMAKKEKDKKFILAGDAIYGDHPFGFMIAKDLASTLDNVKLIPNPADKDQLYCDAEAFIYPVKYTEAFGLVLLEAARLNTKIIVPEDSRKYITPELYPIIDNPSWRTIKKEGFTVDNMVEKWLNFINKAINGYETRE